LGGALLGAVLLDEGASGEELSNAPANGTAYTCQIYSCTGVSVEMVFVKGGTLANSKGTAIPVEDFYIGKYEVTQKQWADVMGCTLTLETMWLTNYSGSPTRGVGDDYPMYCVSWNDAKAFIAALNVSNGGGNKFRLPTEAEWEYAARGGNPQQSYTYAGSSDVGDVAWYRDNSNSMTHPTTELKLPNDIGAYNMSGNVWEWCEDYRGVVVERMLYLLLLLHRAPTACFGAAAGPTMRRAAPCPTGTTTPLSPPASTRITAAALSGSAWLAVQTLEQVTRFWQRGRRPAPPFGKTV
jgi:formylglycine-generating enzyme required for sulfatase activity